MRAVRFAKTGDLSLLNVQEIETPRIADGEALVKISAAAINPSDVKNVLGLMPHTTLPRTPGRDFAGTVVQGPPDLLGAEVWGTGGELGFTEDGSHAEFIRLPLEAIRRKPAALFPEEAAAVGVPFVTAWACLVDAGRLTAGDTVAVIGAAGAVGNAAVQIARWRGARTLGVVRRSPQEADVIAHGATAIVNAEPGGLADALKSATDGKGATLILDTVGGAVMEPCLNALATGGRLIEITAPPPRRVAFDLMDFYRRELTLRGVNTLFLDMVACAGILEQLAPGFDSHALTPPRIAGGHGLGDAAAAYALVQSNEAGGKILLIP